MPSVQRRRGLPLRVWPAKPRLDGRGNKVFAVDLDEAPIETVAVAIPQRSARAEVPGQQEINVTRLIVAANLPDINLWSRFFWMDAWWDAVTPPSYHHGTRHTRHWSIDVRRRP